MRRAGRAPGGGCGRQAARPDPGEALALIALRPARAEDAAAIAAIYAPYVLAGTVSFEDDAPDARGMAQRLAAADGRYPWIVATTGAEAGDAVLGYAYAGMFKDRPAYRWTVETTIYLAGAAQGQGTGRRLLGALLDTLAAQGFIQAIATIALPNDASIRLHETLGFRRAGEYRAIGFKQGHWLDVGTWQRELRDAVVPPPEPRRFGEVGTALGLNPL